MPDTFDPWDDTVEGYYDDFVAPPPAPEPADPEPTNAIATIRARLPELWAEHKAARCQCPDCVISHRKQPGKKRDPITGHGCPLGLQQWQEFAAAKADLLGLLPHGQPDSYVVGCRCERCTAAHAEGKVPSGAVHGLDCYRKYACKCEVCRAASAAYQRDRRAQKAATEQRLRMEIEALRAALKAKG